MKKITTFFAKANRRNLLIVLFIIAIIPPLFSFAFQDHSLPLMADELDYNDLANDLVDGDGYHCETLRAGFIKMPHIRHPMYSFFIASIYFFTNKSLLAVKLAQILMHGLTCLIIFLISDRLSRNRFASFCSGIAWALYPLAISHSLLLISETLFTLLLSLSILFTLEYAQHKKITSTFFIGLFFGLTILTKSLVILYIPVLIFWIVFSVKGKFLIKLRDVFLIGAVMLLAISPWIIRNYTVLGDKFFIASGGGLSFYRYNNEKTIEVMDTPVRRVDFSFTDEQKIEIASLSETEVDNYLYSLGWKFIKTHPKDFLTIRLNELSHFWHLWPTSPKRFSKYYLKYKADENIKDVFIDRSLNRFIDRFKNSYFLYFLKILYHAPYNILFFGMLLNFLISFKINRLYWNNSLPLFLLIMVVNAVYVFHHGSDRYRLPIDPYVFILGLQGFTVFIHYLNKRYEKSA